MKKEVEPITAISDKKTDVKSREVFSEVLKREQHKLEGKG
jgi:hypothetical protein